MHTLPRRCRSVGCHARARTHLNRRTNADTTERATDAQALPQSHYAIIHTRISYIVSCVIHSYTHTHLCRLHAHTIRIQTYYKIMPHTLALPLCELPATRHIRHYTRTRLPFLDDAIVGGSVHAETLPDLTLYARIPGKGTTKRSSNCSHSV